jgi:hypothetical protein
VGFRGFDDAPSLLAALSSFLHPSHSVIKPQQPFAPGFLSASRGAAIFRDLRFSLSPGSLRMDETLHETILELYRQVDAEVAAAGPICQASGRCCRFKEYGHRMYLSNLEAAVLLAGAPPYEHPVSPDFCPFQRDNLCTAREPRPLGCRIFFCDPGYQETGNEITERYLRRLKELAVAHGLEWEYAPLHYFLNEHDGTERLPLQAPSLRAAKTNGRLALPLLVTDGS